MRSITFSIGAIPAILYGAAAEGVYLYLHGKHGCKEQAAPFAALACSQGWQVLAIDLPGHGNRAVAIPALLPGEVLPELAAVMDFCAARWPRVALRAEDLSVWFALLAFPNSPLANCLFVAPVVDPARLAANAFRCTGKTAAALRSHKHNAARFAEMLQWDALAYAQAHPIEAWPHPTAILYPGRDTLTDRPTLTAFARRFGCRVTVLDGAGNRLHTPGQLALLEQWTAANL